MKEAGLEHWNSPNTGATNESGFTGLAAGYRSSYSSGNYIHMGIETSFWSSSESGSSSAWRRDLYHDESVLNRTNEIKQTGYSIRCLSDELSNTTIHVPEDFATIQAAIDYSIDGDSILVSAGTYYENINFNGKNISVIGEDRETTIIDGDQNGATVSSINEIFNFTILSSE